MADALLEVSDLRVHYPVFSGVFRHVVGQVKAVDGVSFQVGKGEVVGLVGESGCGKSTVGRAILCLEKWTSGRVCFQGEELSSFSPQNLRDFRCEVQMVFQDPYSSLNPRKSIGDSLGEPLRVHGRVSSLREQREVVAELLKKVHLSPDVMMRYPHELSGGQQQRVCIGRAIALKPKLIICDEAVSALDVSVQAQVLNLLQELKEDLGLSYLFISHDLSVVRHICDRVIVLYLGKIMEEGDNKALFGQPRHPYTQALLSAVPKDHPGDEKTRVELRGELPSPLHPPQGCPFHTRCPFAKEECKKVPPTVEEEGHRYQCIL